MLLAARASFKHNRIRNCGKRMEEFNPYAPPSVPTEWDNPHSELPSNDIVRDGDKLVLPPLVRLPQRCVLCNEAKSVECQLDVGRSDGYALAVKEKLLSLSLA